MNITTIIGILLGVGLVSGAIFYEAGTFAYFINLSGLVIVMGGTTAATLVSYPVKDVIAVFRIGFIVLKREPPVLQDYLGQILHLVNIARKDGVLRLEDSLPEDSNSFLQDAVQMLVDGYSVEEISDILDERILYKQEREFGEAEVFRTMAKYAPAFGMVGTLIGLILLLVNMNSSGLDSLGAGMAVALVTTFYGLVFSNLIFKPFAVKLERRTREQTIMMRMVKESMIMIAERWHPIKVEDYLNSFLKPGERNIPDRAKLFEESAQGNGDSGLKQTFSFSQKNGG